MAGAWTLHEALAHAARGLHHCGLTMGATKAYRCTPRRKQSTKTGHPTAIRVLAAALLAGAMGTATADDPRSEDRHDPGATARESSQPVDDTWITTKFKADLLTSRDVSALQLSVETVSGVASLKGDVPQPGRG